MSEDVIGVDAAGPGGGQPHAAGTSGGSLYDRGVTTPAEALLEEALLLPAADRALLASDLLASLEDDRADEAAVDQSWSQDTDRRARQLDADEVQLRTWDDLVERVDSLRPPHSAG